MLANTAVQALWNIRGQGRSRTSDLQGWRKCKRIVGNNPCLCFATPARPCAMAAPTIRGFDDHCRSELARESGGSSALEYSRHLHIPVQWPLLQSGAPMLPVGGSLLVSAERKASENLRANAHRSRRRIRGAALNPRSKVEALPWPVCRYGPGAP